jgi:PEP-CTERM motif
MKASRLNGLYLSVLALALAEPAFAYDYDYSYTDVNGSFYSLSIGADTDKSALTETRAVTLYVDTSSNNDQTRFLDAVAVKLTSKLLAASALTSAGPGDWTYVAGGTSSDGCKESGNSFMCASGHESISGGKFTFAWAAVMGANTLLDGITNAISLKAVYDAGPTQPGFYQVSNPMVPVPEPESYAMALVALGVLTVFRRRKAAV